MLVISFEESVGNELGSKVGCIFITVNYEMEPKTAVV